MWEDAFTWIRNKTLRSRLLQFGQVSVTRFTSLLKILTLMQRNDLSRVRHSSKGFTLLEVLIAMSILAFAFTALLGHQSIAIQSKSISGPQLVTAGDGQGGNN